MFETADVIIVALVVLNTTAATVAAIVNRPKTLAEAKLVHEKAQNIEVATQSKQADEFETLMARLARMADRHENDREKWHNEKRNFVERLHKLERDIDELRQRLTNKENEYNQLEAQHEQAQTTIALLRTQLSELRNELEKAKVDLTAARNVSADLRAELTKAKAQIEALQAWRKTRETDNLSTVDTTVNVELNDKT